MLKRYTEFRDESFFCHFRETKPIHKQLEQRTTLNELCLNLLGIEHPQSSVNPLGPEGEDFSR